MNDKIEYSCSRCSSLDTSIFGQLDKELYENISKAFTCSSFPKNERLFDIDQFPKGVYIVHQGKLKICKEFENAKEQIIHICAEGEILGMRAIFSGQKFNVSAIALEECNIAYLEVSKFKQLISDFPILRECIITSLSNELIDRASFIANLAVKNAKQRVGQALVSLSNIYKTLPINLSREDLASFVGATPETVIRVLSEFKNEKIIEIQGRKIIIIDQTGLKRFSGML